MREKIIETHLVKKVDELKGLCLKLPANMYIGIPDRLCILPGPKFVFVELKRLNKSKIRGAQKFWKKRLLALGCEWEMLNSKEKIDEYFKRAK